MKRGVRRFLIGLSALGLVGALGGLLALRCGRPVFYTDGNTEFSAAQLADASMLVWGTPEPEFEVPGPVQGRFETLSDGRLLYGRQTPDGSSDLVIFDPARPGTPPEPVVALNSRGHDLAPVLTPDGTLYFSSDRRGGAGGFDLYRAAYRGGVFRDVERLSDDVNSVLDETDPAPDPSGDAIVFVRRDPEIADGANGQLMVGSFEGEPAVPLYEPREPAPLDRDPCFAEDGVSLWFVRATEGEPPAVYRTWRFGGVFAPPSRVLAHGVQVRAPDLSADGMSVRLVAPGGSGEPGTRDLVYVARARELFPWWAGQAALELALFIVAILCAILLLLLWLGTMWRQLDVVTWCLILSAFLHFLLLMLLTDVEIVRRFLPSQAPEGRLQVELVSGTVATRGGGMQVEQAERDAYNALRFAGHTQELAAAAPSGEVAESQRAELERGEWQPTELPTAAETAQQSSVEDAREFAPRGGVDQARELAATETEAVAVANADVAAARTEAAARSVEVAVPGTAPVAEPTPRRTRTAAVGDRSEAVPDQRPISSRVPTIDDAVAAAPTRTSTAAEGAAAPTPRNLATSAQAVDTAAPVRPDVAAPAGEQTTGPSVASLMVAAERAVEVAPSGTGDSLPQARAPSSAKAPDLRDRVESVSVAAREDVASAVTVAETTDVVAQAVSVAPTREADPMPAAAPGVEASIRPPDDALRTTTRRASRPDPRNDRALPKARSLTTSPLAFADRTEVRDDAVTPQASEAEATRLEAASAAPTVASVTEFTASRGEVQPTPIGRPKAGVARPKTAMARPTRRAPEVESRRSGGVATHRSVRPDVALRDRWVASPAESTRDSTNVARSGRARRTTKVMDVTWQSPTRSPFPRPERRLAQGEDRITGALALPASRMARAPRADLGAAAAVVAAAPANSVFQNRFGALKTKALEQYGGTEETERAVRLGLDYLASIQNRDGSWGRPRYADDKYGEVYVGKTALCLLAFLGGGHTPTSSTEYSDVAQLAVQALLRVQDRDTGHFGRTSSYGHGIATYALAECYGMTQSKALREPVDAGLQWILANQSRSRDPRNGGGWGYYSYSVPPEDRFSRASVTAWMVMALESGRLSGFDVPERALAGARDYLLNSWDGRRGFFRYNHRPDRLASDWKTLPASTPASVFALFLLGHPMDDPRIRTGLGYTLQKAPEYYRRARTDDDFVLRGRGNVYFWYYGTLASFVAGGEEWQQWNAALKRVLPDAQNRDGSFEPIGPYAEIANDTARDKSYTTAMCVLSLEIYYRYFTPLLKPR